LFNERVDDLLRFAAISESDLPIYALVAPHNDEFPEKRNYAYCSWDGSEVRIVFSPKILKASKARADALIRHELAHALMMSEEKEHTERETDALAEEVWGDPIYYDKDDVQTLDKRKATTRLRPSYLPNPRPNPRSKSRFDERCGFDVAEWEGKTEARQRLQRLGIPRLTKMVAKRVEEAGFTPSVKKGDTKWGKGSAYIDVWIGKPWTPRNTRDIGEYIGTIRVSDHPQPPGGSFYRGDRVEADHSIDPSGATVEEVVAWLGEQADEWSDEIVTASSTVPNPARP